MRRYILATTGAHASPVCLRHGAQHRRPTAPASLLIRPLCLAHTHRHPARFRAQIQIALRHLLPKQVELHGLAPGQLQLGEAELDHLISGYTREAGVRELERKIGALCRSLAANVSTASEIIGAESYSERTAGVVDSAGNNKASGSVRDATVKTSARRDMTTSGAVQVEPVRLSKAGIEAVLGPPRFDGPADVARRVAKPGIALGLAATAYGGETLYVEVEMVKGKGAVQLTGNIKEVMQVGL